MGGAYSRPASSPWLKHQAAVHVVTARPVTTWVVRGGAAASTLEPREPPCAGGRAPQAVAASSAATRSATLSHGAPPSCLSGPTVAWRRPTTRPRRPASLRA
eukprot:scaffold21104_cov69-Phaeocystis_antarctica.AAC.4